MPTSWKIIVSADICLLSNITSGCLFIIVQTNHLIAQGELIRKLYLEISIRPSIPLTIARVIPLSVFIVEKVYAISKFSNLSNLPIFISYLRIQ